MSREIRPNEGIRPDIRVEVDETPLPKLPEAMQEDPDWVYKWLRVKLDNEDDWENITRREREGWEFLRAEDYPDLHFPSQTRGAKKGMIGLGDVALGRLPRWVAVKRQAILEQRAAAQMQAVRYALEKNADSRFPLINESKTEVGTGKNARFDK